MPRSPSNIPSPLSSAPSPAPAAPERVSIDLELLRSPEPISVLNDYYDLRKIYQKSVDALVDADKATRLGRIADFFERRAAHLRKSARIPVPDDETTADLSTSTSDTDVYDDPIVASFDDAFDAWIKKLYTLESAGMMPGVMRALPLFRDIAPEELDIRW